jgi:peptidoglycan-associated lipoprotein
MSKRTLLKKIPWNIGIISHSMLLLVGCSAFHEVSVVSHGDEAAAVEEVVVEKSNIPTPPPIIDSTVPQLEQEEEKPATLVPHAKQPALITPPPVSPSMNDSMVEENMTQSSEDSAHQLNLQDIFFDFDQIQIRRDAIPLLEQNAKVLLKRYAHQEVLIQGHCDEFGTEEYNFILGKRRAMAVKNYLIDLGVPASQLEVLSLGKNLPFCSERTISCFRHNRRAHFVLQ